MKFRFLRANIIVAILFSISFSTLAEEKFKENSNYKRVAAAGSIKPSKNKKIDVTEFFLYSCKPCFELDSKLAVWVEKNKDKVNFTRVPAVISASWVPLAKAYYVAKKLNVLDKTHQVLFKSIHEDKKVYLNEYTLSKFYLEHGGISQDVFMREFNAKDVVDKVSDARIKTVQYGFRGVPAVVINNEFKTAPFYNRDQQQMIEVMDYLLKKVTTEK